MWHPIRPRHELRDIARADGAVGPVIRPGINPHLAPQPQDPPVCWRRRSPISHSISRACPGSQQVFAPVLNPFDRPAGRSAMPQTVLGKSSAKNSPRAPNPPPTSLSIRSIEVSDQVNPSWPRGSCELANGTFAAPSTVNRSAISVPFREDTARPPSAGPGAAASRIIPAGHSLPSRTPIVLTSPFVAAIRDRLRCYPSPRTTVVSRRPRRRADLTTASTVVRSPRAICRQRRLPPSAGLIRQNNRHRLTDIAHLVAGDYRLTQAVSARPSASSRSGTTGMSSPRSSRRDDSMDPRHLLGRRCVDGFLTTPCPIGLRRMTA